MDTDKRYYTKTGKPNVYTKIPLIPGGELIETTADTCVNQLKASRCCRVLNQCGRGCLSNKEG